jgi:hypothetical protein
MKLYIWIVKRKLRNGEWIVLDVFDSKLKALKELMAHIKTSEPSGDCTFDFDSTVDLGDNILDFDTYVRANLGNNIWFLAERWEVK